MTGLHIPRRRLSTSILFATLLTACGTNSPLPAGSNDGGSEAGNIATDGSGGAGGGLDASADTVTDSVFTDSAVTDSVFTDSVFTDSVFTDSAVTDSAVTDSAVTDSAVTDSAVTDSAVTDSLDTTGNDTGPAAPSDTLIDGTITDATNLCPAAAPKSGGSCPASQACAYGTECCCGQCQPSLVCSCSGGAWQCMYTDFCLSSGSKCPDILQDTQLPDTQQADTKTPTNDAVANDAQPPSDGDAMVLDTVATSCGGVQHCPCASADDCDSGLCVPSPAGPKVCTQTCVDSCPTGYVCKAMKKAGGDQIFLCLAKP